MIGEHGICIDCGQHTPLRLPRRFPHICTDCLFPQPPPEEDRHREADDFTPPRTLIEALHHKIIPFKFEKPIGREHGYKEGPPK